MRSPLFEGVPEETVSRLLSGARRRAFSKGEVVFHDGDLGDTLHVIEKGRFRVRVTTFYGDIVTLVVLGEGDIFGELALLEVGAVRRGTVIALEAGSTRAIHRTDFEDLRRRHPSINDVLLSILSQKVRRGTDQLVEALYVPAEIRVLKRVLELADLYGRGKRVAIVPLTQEDVAGLAGTSRATVNRVLRKEEDRGHVSLERGKIAVLDREALKRRSE
jgi:CRP-like cAMP-binding protein